MVDVIGKYIYMYQCAKDASELSVLDMSCNQAHHQN